jgi:hypothetical protein
MDEWKTIETATRYQINRTGIIRNIETGLILKAGIDRYGYPKIHLIRDDGTNYYTTIHRLVALAWVSGASPNLHVNHIDGDKTNNYYTNLEWVNVQQNIIHSYDILLNTNTQPVLLIDKILLTEVRFRSIKSVAKHLNINSSVLIPLILNSPENPIQQRFIIKLLDETELFNMSNTRCFGKPIYVFDQLSNKVELYPSILIASYFTGVRSLASLRPNLLNYTCIGYCFAFDKEHLIMNTSIDRDVVLKNREIYLNSPYMKREYCYYLYDYYSKKEWKFDELDDLVNFVNERWCLKIIDNISVSSAICKGHKAKRSGILRGFGVRSDKHSYNWYPYWEEVIITNRAGRFAVPVFRVKIDYVVQDFIGIYEVCKFLNYHTEKELKHITINEIMQSLNIPKLSIERLNRPIKYD